MSKAFLFVLFCLIYLLLFLWVFRQLFKNVFPACFTFKNMPTKSPIKSALNGFLQGFLFLTCFTFKGFDYWTKRAFCHLAKSFLCIKKHARFLWHKGFLSPCKLPGHFVKNATIHNKNRFLLIFFVKNFFLPIPNFHRKSDCPRELGSCPANWDQCRNGNSARGKRELGRLPGVQKST